jgi:hypothetical protein
MNTPGNAGRDERKLDAGSHYQSWGHVWGNDGDDGSLWEAGAPVQNHHAAVYSAYQFHTGIITKYTVDAREAGAVYR